MNRFIGPTIIAFSLLVATAGRATADMVHAANPKSVVSALQDAGYRGQLGTDSDGDPKISTTISGLKVTIYFYGCTKNTNCRSLQFSISLKADKPITLERINVWSKENRFSSVYLDDEGDPVMGFDIDTNPTGIDAAVFASVLSHWETVCTDFKAFVWDN